MDRQVRARAAVWWSAWTVSRTRWRHFAARLVKPAIAIPA